MAISERDLKLLWGRAAGRCSICKIPVCEDKQSGTDSFPFGEGAHIVAEKQDGPRGKNSLSKSDRNRYWNLILLCPNCHTKIDNAVEDYTVERLQQIKHDHEADVLQRQAPSRQARHLITTAVSPNKDSYDQFLGFSRITEENWNLPDRKDYVPLGLAKEQWAAPFLEPHLVSNAPENVIRLFEIARGCMISSWWFYPLATLGFEQLTRVGELAIHERSKMLSHESDDFAANLGTLVAKKVISPADEPHWQAMGRLNHDRSHPKRAMLIDPGQAVDSLQVMTDLINALFSKGDAPK